MKVVQALCQRSSLFQSMIQLIQPMCVIAVMATLPLVLRWVGHFEVRAAVALSNTAPKASKKASKPKNVLVPIPPFLPLLHPKIRPLFFFTIDCDSL